ncbi:7536_t:CDS:2 [Ambispora leptoticha]|uniref:7536_t:CDS:1 n=1 Tax=Ambispora leptoticha TaxID=144679 RepID=A0A9N9DBB0_9GLOM|nr:7536_t:CDS:2 [Ambispora leptoticha]
MNHENYADEDDGDIRISLNVGGVKYETCASTLLKYPDSYLMKFLEEKDPDDNDEYFIDRDGNLFWHVLEFYRNGTIVFQDLDKMCVNCGRIATRELLKEEFDFYEIPFNMAEADIYTIEKVIAAKLDDFMCCLKEVFTKMVVNFEKQVQITFFVRKMNPVVSTLTMSDHPNSYLVRTILNLVFPFGSIAAKFIESFEFEIYAYLKSECHGFEWTLKIDKVEETVILTLKDEEDINRTEIMEKSCLQGVEI